jgi:hypothetical protein
VLVDNGSSINICPIRTATKIGLTRGQLAPLSLTVRAYDESSRGVIGTFEAECQLGPVSLSMLFHVLEITTYYNLLLGRAWMHPLGIVPSTVHQKLKLQWKGGVLTILGDGEISAPVCDIKINNDIQLQDFEVMKTSSVVIASIMKKMGYQLGMRLGKFNQGIKKLPKVYSQSAKCNYGLGYKEEMGEMPRNKYTLNGNFVKPREDFPYYGFIEPRGGKPRFEIFFKTQLTLEDKSSVEDKAPVEDKVDEDWMGQMDPEAMKMFVQERDVFHIEEELKEDHVAMIMSSDGTISIWAFENNFLM